MIQSLTHHNIHIKLCERLDELGIDPGQITGRQMNNMIHDGSVLYVKRHRDFPGAPIVNHGISLFAIKPGQKLPKVTK